MSYNLNNIYTKPAIDNTNSPVADQRLTVDATVGGVQFTAYTQSSVALVDLDIQDADVMVTFDGSAPTATNGHRLYTGSSYTWAVARFNAAKFIRQGATSAAVQASASGV